MILLQQIMKPMENKFAELHISMVSHPPSTSNNTDMLVTTNEQCQFKDAGIFNPSTSNNTDMLLTTNEQCQFKDAGISINT